MGRAIATIAVIATVTLGMVATTLAGTHSSLQLVRSAPLTLGGKGFTPHQPVRLTVFAVRATTVHLVANAQGRFLARLPLAVDGCTLWSARAVGPAAGSTVFRAGAGRCDGAGKTLSGTGIAGEVTRGPITPACVVEQPCDAPAPNVDVTISRAGTVVAHTTTGADGRFAVAVSDGHYSVAVAGRASPRNADVTIGHIARLDVGIDTGIR